jgi:hypothetical protein
VFQKKQKTGKQGQREAVGAATNGTNTYPVTPAGGSDCNRLKSRINLRLAGVDIVKIVVPPTWPEVF